MTQKHDYLSALAAFDDRDTNNGDVANMQNVDKWAIRHALRFAEKMMEIPSIEMDEAGHMAALSIYEVEDHAPSPSDCSLIFKAMRDAALKELGE